jgi:hypothetical protein
MRPNNFLSRTICVSEHAVHVAMYVAAHIAVVAALQADGTAPPLEPFVPNEDVVRVCRRIATTSWKRSVQGQCTLAPQLGLPSPERGRDPKFA